MVDLRLSDSLRSVVKLNSGSMIDLYSRGDDY